MVALAILCMALEGIVLLSWGLKALRPGPDVYGDGWALVDNPE